MADSTTPAKVKKIVDIAHPGDSAPSPNSKSVIITNRPTMRDPMMNTDAPANDTSEPVEADASGSATHASHGVIQPLASSPKPAVAEVPAVLATAEPAAAKAATDAESSIAGDEPVLQTESEPQPTSGSTPPPAEVPNPVTEPEAPKTTTSSSDAKVGTKDIQTEADEASAEDAKAERQANLQKLVDNKTYYLPINTLETQRTKQFVAVGTLLSILLVLAWADIALDAGLVHIGTLKALTHFFN
jgi:hypothetical protein